MKMNPSGHRSVGKPPVRGFGRWSQLACSVVMLVAGAAAAASPAVTLAEPTHGATVSSPVKLRFVVQGMTVAPAGDVVTNSGHHHLLVILPPGLHKLTVQFGDGAHRSYGPAMSQTITVMVK